MTNRCVKKALIMLAFVVLLCLLSHFKLLIKTYGETVSANSSTEQVMETEAAVTEMTADRTQITDLSDAFHVILNGATKEFISSYLVDEAFLMWLDANYGDDKIIALAQSVLHDEMDMNRWYELTGNSIHVLWLRYCKDTGFQSYQMSNVYWKDCASQDNTIISFAGDINFSEDWCTMEHMMSRKNGIYDCFSKELLDVMNKSDVLVMNNEFTYTDSRDALKGKDYTFRADPKRTELLKAFGTDIVTLANNHVFDFGEKGLADTMEYLRINDIPYVGAGMNQDEASKVVYFVANGRKIAIVSATEIERSIKYTREATETQSGVLKTFDPKKFLPVIERAKASSDYVIVVVHWGTEGTLYADPAQQRLAEQYVKAGADAIIGGHPHRLQGTAFVERVPVAYSLGNFWFSDGSLYTTLAQVIIGKDGTLQLKYLPCLQKNLTTSLITDADEKKEFYHYLASISVNVGMDEEGNVYNKNAPDYDSRHVFYDSETSEIEIGGTVDNEGNAIDIVGNLR